MRFRLLQARLPDDPVRTEERAAFAARLGVEVTDVLPHDLLTAPVRLDVITAEVDAVLVGGSGAFSVYDAAPWLREFADVMGGIADRGFPTFASCFGFQAMVLALGGDVRKDEPGSEVGSFEIELCDDGLDDALFSGLPARFVAQQGHKDRAIRLPSGVVNLARSERCPFQAIRIVGQPVYATQFHPELTGDDNRTRFSRYFEMYKEAFGAADARRMLDEFKPSPEANTLLPRFARLVAGQTIV